MSQASLKVGPLPDRTPVKVSVACDPALHDDLKAYANVHSQTYGKTVSVADLIPSMLRTLIDSDTAFKRALRQLNAQSRLKGEN